MSDALLDRLRAIVGPAQVLVGEQDTVPFVVDWRGAYRGRARAVVRPGSRDEVAAVVRACADAGAPVVPQGGNTGMCGGATPAADGSGVVVAMGRMNRILDVDARNNTLTAEAGTILATIQQRAREAGRLFPLSLAAEGSCQIGGNVATNAGGINVLRYGNARDLVLGLEAVLPDGSCYQGLRALRKDNRGYDLRQLFVGSEGTLGVITAVVLKLFARPVATVDALMAFDSPAAALDVLERLRSRCGDAVQAYELIGSICLELVTRHVANTRMPLEGAHRWYVLMQAGGEEGLLREAVEAQLAEAAERGEIADAVIAGSVAQSAALWKLREAIPEAIRAEGPAFRSDISVAPASIPDFIAAASAEFERRFAGSRVVCFGHVGDGNLHYNALLPPGADASSPMSRMAEAIYDLVARFGGSFSAEHGIGQAKRGELARYKDAVELAAMRRIKDAFDPRGIMNPGKIFPDDQERR